MSEPAGHLRIVEGGEAPIRMHSEALPCHDARLLTAGGREARIVLDGAVYSLRITRQGKLILTK